MIFNQQAAQGGGGVELTYQKQTNATTVASPTTVTIPNVDKLPQALIVDTTGRSTFPWLQ